MVGPKPAQTGHNAKLRGIREGRLGDQDADRADEQLATELVGEGSGCAAGWGASDSLRGTWLSGYRSSTASYHSSHSSTPTATLGAREVPR